MISTQGEKKWIEEWLTSENGSRSSDEHRPEQSSLLEHH